MEDNRRLFLIVLDSVGIGEAPDAAQFGDEGSNTVRAAVEAGADLPNLRRLGLCPGAQSQTTQTHFRADIEAGGGEVWICCANRREILLNILLNFQRIPQKLFAANHFKILRLKIFA